MINLTPKKSGGYIIHCNSEEEWRTLVSDLIEREWWPTDTNALLAYESDNSNCIRLSFYNYAIKGRGRDNELYYTKRYADHERVEFSDIYDAGLCMDDVVSAMTDLL